MTTAAGSESNTEIVKCVRTEKYLKLNSFPLMFFTITVEKKQKLVLPRRQTASEK